MARQRWRPAAIFLLFSLFSLALAASPTTFCKCTCFTNSTIIPFSAPSGNPDSASNSSSAAPRICNDCTRQFCLSQGLAICSDAGEEDVFTLCFQRDSTKDEAVIFIFIVATAGLLVWAGVKPWVLRWRRGRGPGPSYAPVGGGNGQ